MTDITPDAVEELAKLLDDLDDEPEIPFKSDAYAHVAKDGATVLRALRAALTAAEAREQALRDALGLAIGLGCDLGMTDMEVDAIRDRAALAQKDATHD